MPFAVILRKVDHLRDVSTRPTGWVDAELAKKGRFVNVTSISFGLLIGLFTILLLHWIRKLKPEVAGFRSQRMCPFCGLLTSRLNPRCLECGVASILRR